MAGCYPMYERCAEQLEYYPTVLYALDPPLFTTHPISKNFCQGNAQLVLDVDGTQIAGGRWEKNGNSLGISGITLVINNPTAADQGSYRYRASNGCQVVYSNTANVSMIATPNPSYSTFSSTNVGRIVALQAASVSGNHTWRIQEPQGALVTLQNATHPNPSFTPTKAGTYRIQHTVGNSGCSAVF